LDHRRSFSVILGTERTIRGDWFPAKEPSQGTIIVIHGYKGFKDYGMFPYIGEALCGSRDVVIFNFSHNGVGGEILEITEPEKFAKNTYSLEQDDLLEVVGAIRSGTLPPGDSGQPSPGPVYLLGHSKGGGAALLFALDHPELIAGVISWNGIADVDLFSEEEKRRMRAEGRAYTLNARTKQMLPLDRVILDDMERNRERFDLIGRIGELRIPAVLIQGEKDAERLLRGSARLIEAQPHLRWHLVPGGDHRFNTVHPYAGETEAFREALRLTLLWLDDQM
jgi:pimeloyl-ACP methyl ester carboxylesterase